MATYSVHAGDNGEVLGRGFLGSQEEADSLSSRDVDHIGLSFLRVDAIDLNNAHSVVLEPEILASKGSHVNNAEQICGFRFDRDSVVHGLVHESVLGDGFGTRGVRLDHEELVDEVGHLIVVPVGEGQDQLLIDLVLIREVLVMDNQRTAQTVGVLRAGVGVIPVSARLGDLDERVRTAEASKPRRNIKVDSR